MNSNENVKSFTPLDWIGIFFVIAQILGLFTFSIIALRFNKVFIDFGGTLPIITEFVVKSWFSPMLGIICLCIFLFQWLKAMKGNIRQKRKVIIISFFVVSAAYTTCIIGLYLPFFKLLDTIGMTQIYQTG